LRWRHELRLEDPNDRGPETIRGSCIDAERISWRAATDEGLVVHDFCRARRPCGAVAPVAAIFAVVTIVPLVPALASLAPFTALPALPALPVVVATRSTLVDVGHVTNLLH